MFVSVSVSVVFVVSVFANIFFEQIYGFPRSCFACEIVHKWRRGLKGGGAQLFCDNFAEPLALNSVQNCPK